MNNLSRPNCKISLVDNNSFDDEYSFESKAFQKGNSGSRVSYLKAFKKYYIDKLLENKQFDIIQANLTENKENQRVLRLQTNNTKNKKLTKKMDLGYQKPEPNKYEDRFQSIIQNNDSNLEQIVYGSLTQVEQQITCSNDLSKENRILKSSLNRLKIILKEKLEIALKKNKEQVTSIFQEYSSLIKKLLEDKEALTSRMEKQQREFNFFQEKQDKIVLQYEDHLKQSEEFNKRNVQNAKQKIRQFLEIIVDYQEQIENKREQFEKMSQLLSDYELQNGGFKLQKQTYEQNVSKHKSRIEILEKTLNKLERQNMRLLAVVKCESCTAGSKKIKYTEYEIEKQLKKALKKKDQCIERLNLVIDELRRQRYASVDQLTQNMMKK